MPRVLMLPKQEREFDRMKRHVAYLGNKAAIMPDSRLVDRNNKAELLRPSCDTAKQTSINFTIVMQENRP